MKLFLACLVLFLMPKYQAWDNAVYALSSLNAQRCSNQFLSQRLIHKGATSYDVLSSVDELYFIRPRPHLGVYAYKIGWKHPMGIQGTSCVRIAPDTAIRRYLDNKWKAYKAFHTTYPPFN
jgi:hypothetical protein